MFWPIKRIRVGDRERKLLIVNGRFVRILEPGVHVVAALGRTVETETHSITEPLFRSEWTDILVKEHPAVIGRYFTVVETNDHEVAVIYADGKTLRVAAPGCRLLFWNAAIEVRAQVIDAMVSREIPREMLPGVSRLGRESWATFYMVFESQTGLLFIDNRFVRTLAPGMYGFWNVAGGARVEVVETRLTPIELPGQEILTKDKVSIRVNVSAQYRVADAVKARESVKDYADHLYKALQFGARQSLGRKTLDEILAEKVDVDPAVVESIRTQMAAIGIEVGVIALKDIVLPGEVRDIMNQVVAAEKQAQANLIRRREETAATRSLLNTAKLMEENPLLVRLKELETLEKLTDKVERISVHGGFDGLLNDLLTSKVEK